MAVTLKDVGFDNVTDPVVRAELEKALKAAAMTGGRRRGGGPKEDAERRRREEARRARAAAGEGEAPAPAPAPAPAAAPAAVAAAAAQVSKDSVKNPSKLKAAVDTVLSKIVPAGMAMGAAGAITVNRPDLIANLAEVIAITLGNMTDIAVQSTWSDWGQAILGIGRAIGVIGQTGALQAFQGPVVPFAIATAIMTWRAQGAGKTLYEQIKDDAGAAAGSAAAMASRAATAVRGYVVGNPIEDLLALAERTRQAKLAGAGAEDLKDLVRTELRGVPAARGGPAGVSLVPGSAPKDPGAPLRRLAAFAAPEGMGETTRRGSEAISREARGIADARRAAEDMDVDGAAAPARAPEPLPPLAPLGRQTGKRGREGPGEGERPAKVRGVEAPPASPVPKKSDLEELDGGRRRRRKTQKRKAKRRVTRRVAAVKFVY